jgi:hypothetical protein
MSERGEAEFGERRRRWAIDCGRMSAKIVHEDAVVRAATWGGVFFEVWRSNAQPEHFRVLGKLQLAYATAQPDGKMALVSIVRMTNIAGFDRAARQELEVRSRVLNPRLRASAVVLPASGFAASLVRGVLTGVMMVSRSKVPNKVGATTGEVFDWLAPHLPRADRPILAGDLSRVCEPLLVA